MTSLKETIFEVPDQFAAGIEEAGRGEIPSGPFDKVFVCGMGGSAQGGELVSTMLDIHPDIVIWRDYDLPNDVTDKSLVIASSYSGNAEETVSAAMAAQNKGTEWLVITSGGKLAELADDNNKPMIKLQEGYQPRYTIGLQIGALLTILHRAGVIDDQEASLVDAAAEIANISTLQEDARQFAEKCGRRTPLVLSSQKYSSIARILSTHINETASGHSCWATIPEMNHNVINAFSDGGERRHLLVLVGADEHPQILKRMEVTHVLAEENGFSANRITLRGSTRIARLIYGAWFAMWFAFYLAELRGQNPLDIDIIEDFKKRLI